MRVYFIRHGETEGNIKEVYQYPDTPLSPAGLEQSKTLASRFKKIKIDKIFSSPYERTKQTAELVNKVIGKQIEYWEELKELVKPSEFLGKGYFDKKLDSIKKEILEHIDEENWRYSNEENFYDLRKRAEGIVTKLGKLEEGEDILLVTHEGFMKFIIAALMYGENINHELFGYFFHFFKHTNTGITVLEKKGKDWKLLTWNDHAHLG